MPKMIYIAGPISTGQNAIVWGKRRLVTVKDDPDTLDSLLFYSIPVRFGDKRLEFQVGKAIERKNSQIPDFSMFLIKKIEGRLLQMAGGIGHICVIDYGRSMMQIFNDHLTDNVEFSLFVCIRKRKL